MTQSVDPNVKMVGSSQITDSYDWNGLIQGRPLSQSVTLNPIQSSVRFLNGFISQESIDGDAEGARELARVLMLLHSVDRPVSQALIEQTEKCLDYVLAYQDLLRETLAPQDLIEEFGQLIFVLSTLLDVRRHLEKGVMCSYATLNQRLSERVGLLQVV